MTKFRKRPVVIDAIQLTENTIRDAYEFMHGPLLQKQTYQFHDRWSEYEKDVLKNGMTVWTLEDGPDKRAKHVAMIDDWIIKGVAGEFYPCKPDIFEKTYEPQPSTEKTDEQ